MEKIRASQTKSNTMREILKRETGEVLEDFLRASQEKSDIASDSPQDEEHIDGRCD